MSEPALEASGLAKRYGSLKVTRDVSFAIAPGELLALIGPNGAGKSTLVSLLSGRLKPDAGGVRLLGRDVTDDGLAARARAGLVQTFQTPSLFHGFTVAGNVALSAQARLRPRAVRPFQTAARAADVAALTRSILADVGLDGTADRPVQALSHGERRYVELALALAQQPAVLLLDEPLAGLSRAESERMVGFLRSLKGGPAMLLIEHDMDAVFALADRLAVLVEGELVAIGDPAIVQRSPAVRDAYLGADQAAPC